MRILIADDHQMIVEGLELDLQDILPDADIIGTTSAEEALRILSEQMFDVVFLDIDMPEVSGLTIGKMLMVNHPTTNIVYITGYEKYALESYESNPSAFLVKPITAQKLRFALDHLRFPIASSVTDELLAEFYAGKSALSSGIKKCRERRGLTKEQLAERMGVSLTTVFRWESGARTPDTLSLLHLANVLGCGLDDMLEAPKSE